jgi:prepilin-type processing-associated H-X9-DG protein
MSEADNNSQGKQPKTCREAALSFWIAVAGLLALFLVICPLNRAGTSQVGRVLLIFLVVSFELCMVVAFVLGIVGAITIRKNKGQLEGKGFAAAGIALPAVVALGFVILLPRMKSPAWQLMCGTNLSGLDSAMKIYANDLNHRYPSPNTWCDSLIQHGFVSEKQFVCRSGGKGRCHYAMNPNCGPSSPGDTVLLFETKGGWNQYGGPEILTTENHKGKGCNILFNDGHVEFMPSNELSLLKWKAEAGTP